jgi:hypothetical protein
MGTMKISNINTVNLLEVLRELQVIEWTALGLKTPDFGTCQDLPDGREDIHGRIWGMLCDAYFGNQRFTNDSYFQYVFAEDVPLEGDELTLYEHCKDALNDDRILFEVCW